MKWSIDKSKYYGLNRVNDWHKWFAWKPVEVSVSSTGQHKTVWLSFVLKKSTYKVTLLGTWGMWYHEYKELT